MNAALIKSAVAPMMLEADAKSELADEALCGMRVAVLEERGEWRRVRTHYEYEGWVRECDLCSGESLLERWRACPKKQVLQPAADILEEPKVQGRLVRSLTRGALVGLAPESRDGWRRVLLCDGAEGWVWEDFLRPMPSAWRTVNPALLRKSLTAAALLYLGVQYRWGGKTPMGIDCSGLCSMAYLLNGILICRDAHLLPRFPMHEIAADRMAEGDLLFFPGHVAMYLGEKRYIHSTAGNNCHGVVINSLDPETADYRADLPEKLTGIGSVFD